MRWLLYFSLSPAQSRTFTFRQRFHFMKHQNVLCANLEGFFEVRHEKDYTKYTIVLA